MIAEWRVLIVDDDRDVHEITKFGFEGVVIHGKQVTLHSVYSAKEAVQLFEHDRNFAVILLDVVMESHDAGLKLVRQIRGQFDMKICRIILRTGHPGHAPELTVVTDYDINDYVAKSHCHSDKLFILFNAALRSYDLLERLSRSSAGMERILECSNQLQHCSRMSLFAETVVQHAPLVFPRLTNIAFGYYGKEARKAQAPASFFAASENWSELVAPGASNRTKLDESTEKNHPAYGWIAQAHDSGGSFMDGNVAVAYEQIDPFREIIICYEFDRKPDPTTVELIQTLSSHVKSCALRHAINRDRIQSSMVAMAILAHEFRTPLASTRMALEGVNAMVDAETINVKRIKRAMESAFRLIESMNSHIDRSMQNVGVAFRDDYSLPVSELDVCSLINEVVQTHRSFFDGVGLPELFLPDSAYVIGDKDTLVHVMVNLLSNAAKAVAARAEPPVAPAIRIEVEEQEGRAIIRVIDRGVGMSPKDASRMFAPFVSSTKEPSHGLGLTMVTKGVQAMGGVVHCETVLGEGTTFIVQLSMSE